MPLIEQPNTQKAKSESESRRAEMVQRISSAMLPAFLAFVCFKNISENTPILFFNRSWLKHIVLIEAMSFFVLFPLLIAALLVHDKHNSKGVRVASVIWYGAWLYGASYAGPGGTILFLGVTISMLGSALWSPAGLPFIVSGFVRFILNFLTFLIVMALNQPGKRVDTGEALRISTYYLSLMAFYELMLPTPEKMFAWLEEKMRAAR